MNASFNRWHLVNAYGAFGSVTQGTPRSGRRRHHRPGGRGAEAEWRPYEFKGKPGDPTGPRGRSRPYHLRLDWLMWFLALGSRDTRWFLVFLTRLLEADRRTLKLLRVDPFAGTPPHWVRARLYLYRFATRRERRDEGVWWMREEAGILVPPISRSTQARRGDDR